MAFIRNGWFIDHVEAKQEAVKIIAWYEEIKPVAPTPPDALVRAVIRLHDSLSPDETRGVLWRNVEDALYPRGASASDLAPPPDALGEALAQIDGERIRAEAELGGEPWERWRNQGVIAALGFAAAHVRAALEATP